MKLALMALCLLSLSHPARAASTPTVIPDNLNISVEGRSVFTPSVNEFGAKDFTYENIKDIKLLEKQKPKIEKIAIKKSPVPQS